MRLHCRNARGPVRQYHSSDSSSYRDCAFTDCLFIGTHFESVELHGCEFRDCNFFKATLRNVYGRPQQFRDAIRDAKYANIAVHLYQQLRENYSAEAQREFKNEAEYGFAKWRRRNNILQARRQNLPISRYIIGHTISWLYDALFGYGYRLRNLLFTTAGLLTVACVSNYCLTPRFFSHPTHPWWLKTVYFTVTTMCTLGAAGYNPDTEFGYFFVLLNLLLGITILSTALSAMLKKLAR